MECAATRICRGRLSQRGSTWPPWAWCRSSLEDQGTWDSLGEHYWGEEEKPIEEWAKPIIARGPRQMFEMEQVVPGERP